MKLQQLPVLTCFFLLFLLTVSPEFTDAAVSSGLIKRLKTFKEIIGAVTDHPEWFKKGAAPASPRCGAPKAGSCIKLKKPFCNPIMSIARDKGYTCCGYSAYFCCCYK